MVQAEVGSAVLTGFVKEEEGRLDLCGQEGSQGERGGLGCDSVLPLVEECSK